MIIFIVLPKNSGLKRCREIAETEFRDLETKFVRGEDVPFFVEKLNQEGKNAIGITGEDLFKEFLLNSRNPKTDIIRKIPWADDDALFKKPVLCFLGPKGKILEDLPKRLKVCINNKYSRIAKKFLSRIQYQKGTIFDRIYFSGSTEEAFINNICDLVIDIVYSGKSMDKAGLQIYEKIFESDIVIIGNKKKFGLQKLYEIICGKIKSKDTTSYTKELLGDDGLLKRKIIEEAGEIVTAKNKEELIWECSDIIYFLFVIMAKNKIRIKDIEEELERRNKEKLLNKERLDKLEET